MKQVKIRCPYCGSMALLRPAKLVRRSASPEDEVYACARFPACDAYVTAHRDSRLPMGTLANKALRQKRREAHIAHFSEYRCEQVIRLCGCFTDAQGRAA